MDLQGAALEGAALTTGSLRGATRTDDRHLGCGRVRCSASWRRLGV